MFDGCKMKPEVTACMKGNGLSKEDNNFETEKTKDDVQNHAVTK
jgi:hypothetical protein